MLEFLWSAASKSGPQVPEAPAQAEGVESQAATDKNGEEDAFQTPAVFCKLAANGFETGSFTSQNLNEESVYGETRHIVESL